MCMSCRDRGGLTWMFDGGNCLQNKGFIRSENSVILQKSYLLYMNELGYESYISENLYVSPKFDMNKVFCDFAQRYAKDVDFQKWSGFGRILQTYLANVINHSLENFKSQTLYFWKGL